MNKVRVMVYFLLFIAALTEGGCSAQSPAPVVQAQGIDPDPTKWAEFTLITALEGGKMAFVGVGGEIDGQTNPDLVVRSGETIKVVLFNGDGMPHDLVAPDFGAGTALVSSRQEKTETIFAVGESGEYPYFCSVAGHRQAGMEGKLVVEEP